MVLVVAGAPWLVQGVWLPLGQVGLLVWLAVVLEQLVWLVWLVWLVQHSQPTTERAEQSGA